MSDTITIREGANTMSDITTRERTDTMSDITIREGGPTP